MLYRLDKGPLSKIRDSLTGVKDLQADGFVLAGECDTDGNVISSAVVFDDAAPDLDDEPKNRRRKPRDE